VTGPVDMVRAAAKAEAAAETGRAASDRAWRAAWWRTTMALAAVPARPQSLLKAANDAMIAEGLGKDRNWLSMRRRTGIAFQSFALERETLPPRLAVVAATRPDAVITAEVVADILKAEADEVGVRKFSFDLTGKSWTNAPENMTADEQDAVVRNVATRRPHAVAEVMNEIPAAAEIVAGSAAVRRAVEATDRRNEEGIRKIAHEQRTRPDSPLVIQIRLMIVAEELRKLADEAVELMRDGALDKESPEVRAEIVNNYRAVARQLTLAFDLGENGVTVTDEALDEFLNR
jgi:hypothetical protein